MIIPLLFPFQKTIWLLEVTGKGNKKFMIKGEMRKGSRREQREVGNHGDRKSRAPPWLPLERVG